MGLESPFTRMSNLVATNPAGGDGRSTADDHIRGIKAVLKGTAQRMPGAEAISELTISSGAIVPTGGLHTVDTQADASTDDLDTITATNILSGGLLMLASENAARIVTLKHGVDNIVLVGGIDVALGALTTFILLRYDGSNWNEVKWESVVALLTSPTISGATFTGVTEIAAGSAAAPSLGFTGEVTTGLYWASDYIGFVIAGVEKAQINTNGLKVAAIDPASWPSFSVHKNGTDQTGVGTALEIITWSTELFDTNSDFDSNRFTPTAAGKYLLTAHLTFLAPNDTEGLQVSIFKNGAELHTVLGRGVALTTSIGLSISAVVDADGSSDYFEIYAAELLGAGTVDGPATDTWFTGCRIG